MSQPLYVRMVKLQGGAERVQKYTEGETDREG